MKNLLNLKRIFLLAFIAIAVTSCSNDESSTPAPTDNTITGIASRNADLSILVKALTKAGLATTLQGTGPFTVFAPTNQAFTDAGFTATVIDNLPASEIPVLKEILLNHVVSGAVQSTSLQNNSYIKTLAKGSASDTNTLSMFVSTSAGVKLNGISTVTTANVIASNGVVHVVDKVITLPTIVTQAIANADLSILVKALTKAGLATTLQGTGPFTVFAPTNQAFIDAGFTATAIDNLPASEIPVLKEILLNHVVSGAVQSTGLQNNSYIKTLAKGAASSTNTLSMFVSTSSGVKLNGISTVTTANVIASNGVVHVVDKVITLPTIATHAIANPSFTTLVSLLARPGQPDFASVLSGTAGAPFTVFAPVNAAFIALNTELTGGIASVSDNNITRVLQYHVVGGANVLSSTLTEGQVVTPILTPAQTFTVMLQGGAKIKDANNRMSNIVAVDVQCSNGVIHALDKVLLPVL